MYRYRTTVLTLTLTLAALVAPALASGQEATPATPAAQTMYTVTDLGTLGGEISQALDMNASGQVVGESTTGPDQQFRAPGSHAFLWDDGEMTDLGTLGGELSGTAGLNDQGQVVGFSTLATGETRGFLWENGEMTDLGTLGGSHSDAVRINNRGQVVGLSTTAPGQELGDPGTHAFLWEAGEMIDLGTLGGEFSRANDINEAGQVVGGAETADGETHFFLWEDGEMTDLGGLPGYAVSRAIRANDAGQVVGFATAPVLPEGTPTPEGPPPFHPVLWENGEMTDLGFLPGYEFRGFANGIDEDGRVVGRTEAEPASPDDPPGSHAFIWEDGVMTDLNDLIVDSDLEIGTASAINERGQISASGGDHGVLLTPADDAVRSFVTSV